jgi:hypothetical protein
MYLLTRLLSILLWLLSSLWKLLSNVWRLLSILSRLLTNVYSLLSIQRKLLTNVWNRRRTIALCSINGWQAQTGTLVSLFCHFGGQKICLLQNKPSL